MSMLFSKVPSGVDGLDNMLGGGYTKNNIITVSGSTGSGRTTFATQFLVQGWHLNQEPGLYLSFDEPKFSIFANMSSYEWDLPQLERDKHVVFIEYPHNELDSFLEQEGSILELIDTLGVERVVFDSITPLALMFEGDERRQHLQKLINIIRRWGATTMITAEDMHLPEASIPRTTIGVESVSDGFIHLGWAMEGLKRIRTLEVVKMRGSAHENVIRQALLDNNGFHMFTPGNKRAAPDALVPQKNPYKKEAAEAGAGVGGKSGASIGSKPGANSSRAALLQKSSPQGSRPVMQASKNPAHKPTTQIGAIHGNAQVISPIRKSPSKIVMSGPGAAPARHDPSPHSARGEHEIPFSALKRTKTGETKKDNFNSE